MIISQKHRLLLELARCNEINIAKVDVKHPCNNIICSQTNHSIDKFHLPEPWNGNIEKAKILFISSNPSIDIQEIYPTDRCNDNDIVDFFERRFLTKSECNYPKFWKAINKWTGWILNISDNENLLNDNVTITEIVHCKSQSEYGVENCKDFCVNKWLKNILDLFNGNYIVLIGTAKQYEKTIIKYAQKKVIIKQAHPNARGITDEERKQSIIQQLSQNESPRGTR